ncbi:hypothetical protein FSOLCH5_012109 [Fusarium solani]
MLLHAIASCITPPRDVATSFRWLPPTQFLLEPSIAPSMLSLAASQGSITDIVFPDSTVRADGEYTRCRDQSKPLFSSTIFTHRSFKSPLHLRLDASVLLPKSLKSRKFPSATKAFASRPFHAR